MLSKWKNAVVHLECATDSEHLSKRIKRIDEARRQLKEGRIMYEEFANEVSGRSRDVRFHGTALFLTHEGRRYLLTARHVVWDEYAAKQEFKEALQRAASFPEHMRKELLRSSEERAKNQIFSIVFRVPSLDEVLSQRGTGEFLMNLGAGTTATAPYTFSEPDTDLALISLDSRDSRFAEELLLRGYSPIASDDIIDGPTQEGQELFTIGFPSATALLGQVDQTSASAHWSSSHFSLPVSSFGESRYFTRHFLSSGPI